MSDIEGFRQAKESVERAKAEADARRSISGGSGGGGCFRTLISILVFGFLLLGAINELWEMYGH